MMSLTKVIENAQRRVETAREIADHFRGDVKLHRLSMQTVFVLEDVLFALRQTERRDIGNDIGKPSPVPRL